MLRGTVLLALAGLITSALFAQVPPQRNPHDPAVIVDIAHVKTDTDNSRLEIPIMIANPSDTVAGFELWIYLTKPSIVRFKAAAPPSRNLTAAELDTTGARISGWEYLETNILDFPTSAVLKVVGLAEWQDGAITPGFGPGSGRLLGLVLETVGVQGDSLCDSVQIGVVANVVECGFSDPLGNLLEATYTDGSVSFACCLCGDCDCNGSINISDAVCLVQHVFGGTPFPGCGDADGNQAISISDCVRLISFIFAGGPDPGLCGGSICH